MYENFLLTSYFIVVLGFFAIGLLVALRQKTTTYRNFAAFAFFIGTWQLLQFISQILAGNHSLALSFLRASIVVSGVMATSFLIFAESYVGRRVSYWLYVTGTGVGLLTIFSENLQTIIITREGIGVPKLDAWYGSLLLYAGFCIAYGIFAIVLHYKRATNQKQRSQDRIILVSTFVVGLLILLASFSTSEFSNSTLAQHVVPFACMGAMLSFTYAIVYRGLFDIHFFVVRAAAYLSTLLTMTLIFVIPVVLLFDKLLGSNLKAGAFFAIVLTSVALLYLLQYLRKIFDKITTKIFFRQYYDPQEVLDKLSDIVVGNVERDVLQTQSAELLHDAIRPQFLSFLLFKAPGKDIHDLTRQLVDASANIIVTDELDVKHFSALSHALKDKNVALGVKLRTTHEDLGFMILGHKQSGEIYSERDKRMLGIASDEIAIALQNALRFEEIERFNQTLQEKIEEATRKLRQTNEKLRKLDETKDDFISMASHQLRTPLTSVKGYVSMVLDGDAGKITSLQRKLLTQSFISSQRMVYLISDLLNVSRLKTGKFIIEAVPTNLANVIEEEINQLQETAKGRNLELIYKKPEHFPTLMLDETKIRQVLMNFIDNAVYYTPSGGHITINLVDRGRTIEYTVVDDGIGVPKHEQHHLFSKFFRAHNAKRARPDGTGLGLFMAKKVIIAQGGALIFKSQEGRGSTFGFTFAKERLLPEKAKSPGAVTSASTEVKNVK